MERKDVMNEAVFSGRIVSIRGDGVNGSMTLACPSITRANRKGKMENEVRTSYPVLSFNKDTATTDILSKFKRGDHVAVKGYVRSYLRMNDSGDAREILNVYIKEVDFTISKMFSAFGRDGRTFPDPLNEVYLSGTIVGITKRSDNIITLRIDISSPQKKNIITATYYRAPAGLASKFVIGDSIDVLATMQTVDTKEHTKIRDYQSLVILDIEKREY